ncbi:MAG: hypothetical protein MJ252_28495 [archaeon]|nr:hypothetical protein [archaeon]
MDADKYYKEKFEKEQTITREDFRDQVVDKKLSLKKEDRSKKINKRRTLWLNNIKEHGQLNINAIQCMLPLTLTEISYLLFNNPKPLLQNKKLISAPEDSVQFGLQKLYEYFIDEGHLKAQDIKSLKDNFYYRLLDLFKNCPKYTSILIPIYIYLTDEIDHFVGMIVRDGVLNTLGNILQNNDIYQSCRIDFNLLVSNILSENQNIYNEITKFIDIGCILRWEMNNGNYNENYVYLLYNFLVYLPKDQMVQYNDIIFNTLKLFTKEYNEKGPLLNDLFDIIIVLSKNENLIQVFLEQNFVFVIKDTLQNNSIYIHKVLELLFYLLKGNDSQKDIIIGNNPPILPFFDQVKLYYDASIKHKTENNSHSLKLNEKFLYEYLHCIRSLIYRSIKYSKGYFSQKIFYDFLMTVLESGLSEKIKNEVLIIISVTLDLKNDSINAYFLKEKCHKNIYSYVKSIMESQGKEMNLTNALIILEKLLNFGDKACTSTNLVLKDLYGSEMDRRLSKLIDYKNQEISDVSRSIYVKYFNQDENYYVNEAEMILEGMGIDLGNK